MDIVLQSSRTSSLLVSRPAWGCRCSWAGSTLGSLSFNFRAASAARSEQGGKTRKGDAEGNAGQLLGSPRAAAWSDLAGEKTETPRQSL